LNLGRIERRQERLAVGPRANERALDGVEEPPRAIPTFEEYIAKRGREPRDERAERFVDPRSRLERRCKLFRRESANEVHGSES